MTSKRRVARPIPASEPEGFAGRLARFIATLVALVAQLLLPFGFVLDQLLRAVWHYPAALVRAWLPRKDHPLPNPLHDEYFQNIIGNQFAQPTDVRQITSLAELVQAVREAEAAQKRAHPIGSGHSFSDVAIADGVLIALRGLNAVGDVDVGTLREPEKASMLVRAEAGVAIRELNQALFARDQALPNMGGYDGQTLSGAISTGTHGSGMELGPLSDMVRSVDLVTEGGKVCRIEPQAGISSPAEHARALPDIELIQDDSVFYSVVVALGSMGIVHSYVIEVVPAYLLSEHREVLSWRELKQKLKNRDYRPQGRPAPDGEIRHLEFLVNPYGTDGNNQCLVTYRWIPERQAKTHGGRSRPFLATLVTSIREFDQIYALALNVWPSLSRLVVKFAISQLVDRRFTGQSYQVLHLGDVNYVPAYSAELAFSAEPEPRSEDDPQYMRALERLFALAEQQAKRDHYHNVPLSVRFVASSPHFLALSQGRRTAIIEIPLLAGVPGGWDLLRFYERCMFNEFKARAHWGQANFAVGADRIGESYPQTFPIWLRTRERLCPRGTFDNSFTERMGLRTLTRAGQGARDA